MTDKEIIFDEADNFSKYLERFDNHQKFKDALILELNNYYDSPSIIVYLKDILKNIIQQYDKHLEKCEFKNEPLKCVKNNFYLKSKYFTEQEINKHINKQIVTV